MRIELDEMLEELNLRLKKEESIKNTVLIKNAVEAIKELRIREKLG